jgi:hypothetical protein
MGNLLAHAVMFGIRRRFLKEMVKARDLMEGKYTGHLQLSLTASAGLGLFNDPACANKLHTLPGFRAV